MLKLEGVNQIVSFLINDQRFAIRLSEVKQIIRAVEITPIPNAPEYICGVIDMHGAIIPVMNLHVRIGLPDRPTLIDDRFIIALASDRVVALRVDGIKEIIYHAEDQFLMAEKISTDLELLGIIRSHDGLILIYNLETFLKAEEIVFIDKLIENSLFDKMSNERTEERER